MLEEREYEKTHHEANPWQDDAYGEAVAACYMALFDEPEEDRPCYKCCTVEIMYDEFIPIAGDPDLSKEDCAGNISNPESHWIDVPLNED